MRTLIRSASIAAFVFAAAGAGAQTPSVSSRWQAWIGCWRAMGDSPAASSRVCVVPSTSTSSVEILTVDSGKVLSRYTVDASGAQRAVNREGCDGWERASWSADSLRVFLRSELKCGVGLKRASSGIMSITPGGDWVDVQTVVVAENEMVRTVRYAEAAPAPDFPEDVASAIAASRRLDTKTALVAAGAQLTAADILEATRAVDTSAVQAWLVERRQLFSLDARSLVMLADAGVPGSITDMMVALSYPERFSFDRDANTLSRADANVEALSALDSARIASNYLTRGACSTYSYSFAWGTDPCYGYYGRYGYTPYYGYRYGSAAYGYSPYYGGYYGYYTRPIVIVRKDEPEHGRAVNGRGYTRGSTSSTESASRDAGSSSSRSSGSSSRSSGSSSEPSSSGQSSSGGSSSSTSSGSAASSSSTGRTAHPRPPKE